MWIFTKLYQLFGPDGLKGLGLVLLILIVWGRGTWNGGKVISDGWDATLKDPDGKFPRSPQR